MLKAVYSGYCRLSEEDSREGLTAAFNYANSLIGLRRFKEANALYRKSIPMARRVLKENDQITLAMRMAYAETLYREPAAPLDDLREAVTTLEAVDRIAQRVFGSPHPITTAITRHLQNVRTLLHAHEALPSSA